MSTEIIRSYKDQLVECIEEANLDILEKVDAEEVADLVIDIACKLSVRRSKSEASRLEPQVIDVSFITCGGLHEYSIRIANVYGGFVSLSDKREGCTGRSDTTFYPFYISGGGNLIGGMMSLADMLNEAWFNCVN